MMENHIHNIGNTYNISNTTIMGDFNCPYPNDHEQIENLFIKYGMIQHVHQPSHIHGGT